jgi:transposase
MIGLSMLQGMYNGSDLFTEEELKENIYWRYFCGYEYMQQDIDVSEATIRRFRNALGKEGYNKINGDRQEQK